MKEKGLTTPKNRIKFSPLEMADLFEDGDHSHDEFNYKSQLQTGDAVNDILIAGVTSPTSTGCNPAGAISLDPHAHGLGGDLKSAVVGVIKGMVGPAILYLPHGFAKAGWVIAVPMLFASTTLYLASSASLLECWKVETTNRKRLLELETSGDGSVGGCHAIVEMKELRKSNSSSRSSSVVDSSVNDSASGDEFDNEFLEGALVADKICDNKHVTTSTSSASAPLSYPDLAKKAYGSNGQNLVKVGIAASKYSYHVLCFLGSCIHR